MAKVRTEHKAALMASGQWPEFVRYRDGLKSQGVASCDANRQAVSKFLAVRQDTIEVQPVGLGAESSQIIKVDPSDKIPPGLPGTQAASLSDFAGREASEVDIIRWVARNMDVVDVRPSDCPDAAAWSLLNQCRMNAMFRAEFWRSMYTKIIPSRGQLGDDAGGGKGDGSLTVALIEKLLAMKVKAEGVE
jgi:hypothetical protein